MKKRKGSLCTRMLSVLLSTVLVIGMVSNAAPVIVLAQELGETQISVSGNSAETVKGDTDTIPEESAGMKPAEGTDYDDQEDPTAGDTEETVTKDADNGAGQETPGTVTAEETEPGTVSGNDAGAEPVAEPQTVMKAAAPVAQAGLPVQGEDWQLDADGTLTITSDAGMAAWTMTNPVEAYGTDVKSVVIGADVTSIIEGAFLHCDKIESISIPGTVKSIEERAFGYCEALTDLEIPEGVESIGDSVFAGCSELKTIVLPDTLKTIEDYAFSGCGSLSSITVPKNVTVIGNNAFSGCGSLSSITIPESVTDIGDLAFDGCSSLTEVFMESETPPALGAMAFMNCKFVTKGALGIQVPENAAAAYKKAPGWDAYQDNITDGILHIHEYGDWQRNNTQHWKACSICETEIDRGNHDFGGWITDREATAAILLGST